MTTIRGRELIVGARSIIVEKQCTSSPNRFVLLLVYSRARDSHFPSTSSSSSFRTRRSLYPFVIPLSLLKERFPFLSLHLIYLFFSSFIRSLFFYYFSLLLFFFLRHHRLNKVQSGYSYLSYP